MMTLEQIQKLADEMGVDIEGHILSMPIERQVEFAKELGYGDDFDRYVKENLEDALETQQDEEGGYVLTAREALEEVPVYERYSYAGYLGRVYGGDMAVEDVLKHAGYSDDEIAELKFIEQDYYQNPEKYDN